MAATPPLPELGGFLKTMEELKGMVAGMVEEKRKGAPGEALAAQGKRCVLKMAEVRKANRDAHEAADGSITAAEAERHETDIVSQQLQNLQYQKVHLSRELQMCLSYKGCEDLELITEEEFEACTPEEKRGGPRGSHAYELARLTAEMKKREEVIKSLKQQDLRRKLYQGKLQTQRKFLDSLHGHLDAIHSAAEPVRKEFSKTGPFPSLDSTAAAAAQLLPAPLYSIYYQAHAYEVNFGEETVVTIEGDVGAAQALSKSQANIPDAALSPSQDSKKRRKRKGEEEREEKGEDVTAAHPLTIRIKLPPPAGSKAPTLSLTFSYLYILQVVTVKHALSPLMGSAAETEALLEDLYPNDTGELSPLVSADYLMATSKVLKSATTGVRDAHGLRFSNAVTHGKAFKWAQRVASLRYPPREHGGSGSAGGEEGEVGRKDVAAQERTALRTLAYGSLVRALRHRVSMCFEVRAMLSELHQLSTAAGKSNGMAVPEVPGSHDLPSQGASMLGWSEVTKEVLAALAVAEGAEDDMVLDKESEPNTGEAGDEEGEVLALADPPEPASKSMLHPTEKHAAQMARKGHRFFRATLSKTVAGVGTWMVQAEVELAGGYPKAAPVWTLKLMQSGSKKQQDEKFPATDPVALAAVIAARQRGEETDTQLKSIEAEVNLHAASHAASRSCPRAKLLVYQIWVVLHCFSTYVDAESSDSTGRRGRDRRLPFLSKVQTDV